MDYPFLAIIIAIPIIAAFFLFVILPRIRRYEEKQEQRRRAGHSLWGSE